jgi:SAM-dependent methyltransferase
MSSLHLDGVVLESRPCPNGCAPADRPVTEGQDRLHGLPGRFTVVECAQCGLMRTDPRPTADTIGAYYPDDYGPYLTSPVIKVKPSTWHRRFKARWNRWLGKDVRRLPDIPPGRMLEIGSAGGAYLLEMQAKGWTVEGIEFSPVAAQKARERGLDVRTGSLESSVPPQHKADVITAWMVLEHLHEPLAGLRKMREWVQPDGFLVAAVPDASALERRVFGEYWYGLHLPAHLYHYTPDSLRRLLDKAGWQLCAMHWQPNPMNLLNSLEWKAQAEGRAHWLRLARWLKQSPKAGGLRRWLGWLLGITRQSGRMEFWARPKRQPRIA